MFAPKIDNDLFQSSLPRGSDQHSSPARNLAMISILAPSRERRRRLRLYRYPAKFQSSLPRGSDYCKYVWEKEERISILAPSRERRGGIDVMTILSRISILAPSRERRYDMMYDVAKGYLFQSSLPRGSDMLLGM